MRWTAAEPISLLTRGGSAAELMGRLVRWGAAELLGWLVRLWTTEELLGWLVWVGLEFGLLLLLAGVASGGRLLVLVFSITVQCGIGGFSVFFCGMVAGVVSGQETLASFLHFVM
jgi:hypothetical protein